ncbi:hypothetical protein EC973_001430 [Apophysomyces ossiformis]|uniref:Fatty acid hydroxylase domain-containing protein n=1 Tax=Apophysomyces ossiformis TaxID=679940 RepID=A0A8H7BHX1_9FUNG|nr:hypothetical protein EC973_001430 [Apophysomyces ossiformis]
MNATTHFFTSTIQSRLQRDPWSDEMLALWVPVVVYWVYSVTFHFVMKAEIPFFERYRIHTSDDMQKRNRVSVGRVLTMVALQQIAQVLMGIAILAPVDPDVQARLQEEALTRLTHQFYAWMPTTEEKNLYPIANGLAKTVYWGLVPACQFFAGMVIMDAHQYFLHRLFHMNKFLYKHIHSHHHRLYVPYAFGALYNHPVEGFMLDTLGATLAFELTGMSARLMDDHCGYALPWDPLQYFFGNNVEYHDIHHQPYGIKKNFSQPFFTFWDKLLGTELPVTEVKRTAKAKAVAAKTD